MLIYLQYIQFLVIWMILIDLTLTIKLPYKKIQRLFSDLNRFTLSKSN